MEELEKETSRGKRRRFPNWIFPTITFGVIFLLLEQAVELFSGSACGFGTCSWLSFSFGAFTMFFIIVILDYYGVI